VRPFSSVATVAFSVFCFFLPETKARRPGFPGAGPSDLHFGAVQADGDAAGGRVGEQAGQGPQPDAGLSGDGEPAGG
jgi:hypothetical protein